MSLTQFRVIALLAVPLLVGPAQGSSRGYASVKAEAERLYAEKSYARAHALYAEIHPPTVQEEPWVAFRLADTRWRMDPKDGSEEARRELSALLESAPHPLWMEVQESLGDSWWVPQEGRQWHRAWPHYAKALGGWAKSRDLERARKRYLGMVDRLARPEGPSPEPYRHYGATLPLEVLENALSLARSDRERARFHYLVATALRNQGDWAAQHRIPAAFEAALRDGRNTPWYDGALHQYAEWLARHGRPVIDEHGGESYRPDFREALRLYRRLVAEFGEGETRYRRSAQRAIEEITSPELQVMVSNVFLPGSEIDFELIARNLEEVDLALHPVHLDDALDLQRRDEWIDWIEAVRLGRSRPLRSWSRDLDVEGEHAPRRERIRLEEPLEAGAYLVLAKSGRVSARALLLVSDAALIVKASGEKLAAFLCDADSGEPLEGGAVVFWTWGGSGDERIARRTEATTGVDGIALASRADPDQSVATLVAKHQPLGVLLHAPPAPAGDDETGDEDDRTDDHTDDTVENDQFGRLEHDERERPDQQQDAERYGGLLGLPRQQQARRDMHDHEIHDRPADEIRDGLLEDEPRDDEDQPQQQDHLRRRRDHLPAPLEPAPLEDEEVGDDPEPDDEAPDSPPSAHHGGLGVPDAPVRGSDDLLRRGRLEDQRRIEGGLSLAGRLDQVGEAGESEMAEIDRPQHQVDHAQDGQAPASQGIKLRRRSVAELFRIGGSLHGSPDLSASRGTLSEPQAHCLYG